MPYARNSELPPGVKDALPDAAQSIYRNAYNSQAKRGLPEERCHASAWAAVQNAGYHKTKDGKWVKKAQPTKPSDDDVTMIVKISEIKPDKQEAFGWASVIEENGVPVIDLQDHVIESSTLEDAAYDFMLNSRIAGEMHERMDIGRMIESMVFTKEKQAALGIDLGKVGWWVGVKIFDADVFAKVKSGERSAFSIAGKAILHDMTEAA